VRWGSVRATAERRRGGQFHGKRTAPHSVRRWHVCACVSVCPGLRSWRTARDAITQQSPHACTHAGRGRRKRPRAWTAAKQVIVYRSSCDACRSGPHGYVLAALGPSVLSDLQVCHTVEAGEGKGEVALQRYVQILGTDAGDCCPCVLAVTESARYLFNAGDGLQVSLAVWSRARMCCARAACLHPTKRSHAVSVCRMANAKRREERGDVRCAAILRAAPGQAR
jgi:hypothetical protein